MARHGDTRQKIVEAADTLFYEQGVGASSFADIAGAVGLSRGNFYHHFQSKDAILEAVIERRLTRTREMLAQWQRDGGTPRDRIVSFVQMLIANRAKIMAFGCPVGTLSTELAKLDHIAAPRAAEVFTLFLDWLEAQFQAAGFVPDRARALAHHAMMLAQGIATLAAAFKDETQLRQDVDDFTGWLDETLSSKG
ncbi:TetR/AcrR family transcriptional regulator [Celeribacter sp. PS-C1]|uniref:TetR/AcrR family transcriptional regulator n=1 Tax=Celeribacter sp. PS-C1 TaxID=2820813 RepID=UPI001C67C051|nr:TetR/AcrR family transcriptional regulator [Celeribacter sp. PS-C1]MBW6418637.1 TetR/AcrR family transcriptional regulator [Celeribacter sp. PS-C1]